MIIDQLLIKLLIKFSRVVRLSESGIYQKWLDTNTYNLKEAKSRSRPVEYSVGDLTTFSGPFLTYKLALAIAWFIFLLEIACPYFKNFFYPIFIFVKSFKLKTHESFTKLIRLTRKLLINFVRNFLNFLN